VGWGDVRAGVGGGGGVVGEGVTGHLSLWGEGGGGGGGVGRGVGGPPTGFIVCSVSDSGLSAANRADEHSRSNWARSQVALVLPWILIVTVI